MDKIREATRHGLAQWRQYPQWARGPARIVGDEVVLDEDRAETYGIHERAKDLIFLELAQLAWGRNQLDTQAISSFVRRNGLLWRGAAEVGGGKCRESLEAWRYEPLEMTFFLEFWHDLRKSIRQDSAVPLRRTLKKYADIFEDAPMDAGDQELMDDVSVNLAEVISGKLQNCRMGLSSSVDLDTDPKGPGIFLMLSSPQICCQPHTCISRSSWLTALLWKSAQGVAESLSRAPVNRSTAARVAPARLAGTAGNKNKLSSYGSNVAAIEVRS